MPSAILLLSTRRPLRFLLLRQKRECCLFPPGERHFWCFRSCGWEKPQLWAVAADCAAQWDDVTRQVRPVTRSLAATRCLVLLRFLTSARDLRGFSFTVALDRGIGLVCQSLVNMRDASPCCGEERRTSQMNEAQAERPRLDRYVDVLIAPALGTK